MASADKPIYLCSSCWVALVLSGPQHVRVTQWAPSHQSSRQWEVQVPWGL